MKPAISESTSCDFKAKLERDKPKSWLKSVSAFANTAGGVLCFGIDNERNVIGVAEAQADVEFISQMIHDRIDPVPRYELSSSEIEGKSVILLEVQKGIHRPYYYRADGRCEAFVRNGDRSERASSERLNELILSGTNRTWDSLDSGISVTRGSFTALKAFYAHQTGFDMTDSDLVSFGLATPDGKNLTNAGTLFADEQLVRQSRLFCTRWTGVGKDKPVDDGEFAGSLLLLLREGEAFVKRHNIVSWEKSPDQRVELRSYSERAVMESLVNALVHRSYLELGSEIHVDIYDDRMSITSPGEMVRGKLPADVMSEAVESHRRNPIVADLFGRMLLMERRGAVCVRFA